nr:MULTISPECIES: hypothetical protein [unclassified Caballeronia]
MATSPAQEELLLQQGVKRRIRVGKTGVVQYFSRGNQTAGSADETLGLEGVTIVRAVTLARAVDDHELALSILTAAHALVMTQDGTDQN